MYEIEEAQKWMTERWATRADHPRWHQKDALILCGRLRKIASQSGWLLGLYGSSLDQKTAGDLDLMFLNWRANASKLVVIKWFRDLYKAKVVDIYSTQSGGTGVGMCTEEGFLIDSYFRISEVKGRTVWEDFELQA